MMIMFLLGLAIGLLLLFAGVAIMVYRAARRLAVTAAPPLDKCHAGETAVAILHAGDGRRQVTPHAHKE